MKKREKHSLERIYDPIFNICLEVFYWDIESIVKYLDKTDVPSKYYEDLLDTSIRWRSLVTKWYSLIILLENDLGTLIHELSHAVFDNLDNRWIPKTEDMEVFCYVIEYFYKRD